MTNDKWREFFKGYFLDTNPHARDDEWSRELWDLFWEIAAAFAFLGFVAWLSLWTH